MKRHSGFTIMELLIVVTVAGILAAIGGPAMGTFIKNNRLQSKTHAVMADILFARGESVTRKKRVVMCRSANSAAAPPSCGGTANDYGVGGYIIFVDEDGDSAFDNGTEELLRRGPAASKSVTVMANAQVNNNLVFRPDGSTDESGGTGQFAICDDRPDADGLGRRLDVPPHGRPRIRTGITDCTP